MTLGEDILGFDKHHLKNARVVVVGRQVFGARVVAKVGRRQAAGLPHPRGEDVFLQLVVRPDHNDMDLCEKSE